MDCENGKPSSKDGGDETESFISSAAKEKLANHGEAINYKSVASDSDSMVGSVKDHARDPSRQGQGDNGSVPDTEATNEFLFSEERYVEGESDGTTNGRFSLQTLNDDVFVDTGEDADTFSSRTNIEKFNEIKNKRFNMSKRDRKESFEQRLRRTFTIKDKHTSEVYKRIVAILIKYALFVFNFVSWVMATAAIGTGIWMRTDQTFMVTSDTDFFLDPSMMTCIGGTITFVVAFLGCVGALRENLILLKVFFYVLTTILMGELTLAIAVFVIYTVPEARENFLRSKPEKILRSAIQKYMDDPEVKLWVDKIQSEFKCCGISHTEEGFRDWIISPYFNCTSSNKSIYRCAVPTSCCIFEKGDRVNIMCGFSKTDKSVLDVRDYIHTRGCILGFGEWLGKYDDLIIISCLSILIMQFLAVLSAKIMVLRIQKQRSRWQALKRRHSPATSNNTATRSEV